MNIRGARSGWGSAATTTRRGDGSRALHASGYTDDALAAWADRLVAWASGGARDVYVYFDNDAQGHAPWNAQSLQGAIDQRLLGAR
ncbi:MAG: DUF72 domain-containing protein [Gemmatimonadaceae bacterium]|nr:DUF72 domain-containing protein [Gemmatimonadaceae bacterium]